MREHLGEEFGGMVSAVTTFGIFVTLDAMYVEGLVHITELGGDYFRFDEARQELRGERSGIRYGIGTRLRVQVSRVDLDGRRIDFRLVRDGEEQPASGRPGRTPARTETHQGEKWGRRDAKEKRAQDRKSTRLNSSHSQISYAVFCLKKKKENNTCKTTDTHKIRA